MSSGSKNKPITIQESGSETDFEDDNLYLDFENEALLIKEAKGMWQSQFEHLLEFSEQILPTALYEPMKWCRATITSALSHIAKTEEIISNMGPSTLTLLQQQLSLWENRQKTAISKSRIPYSIQLYKNAADIFYCVLYQNQDLLSSSAERELIIDKLFESQFGKWKLTQARLLLKFNSKQYSQVEDFLSNLQHIYRTETLAALVSSYLNPLVKSQKEAVVKKINELLSSPDYHENQITLMLLTRQDCEFKSVILECIMKYLITDPQDSTCSPGDDNHNVYVTRERFKLFLEAEDDLLVEACLESDSMSPFSLLHIIVKGLDLISAPVMKKRSTLFEDLRPPLFGDRLEAELSLPVEIFRFMKGMEDAELSTSLREKVLQVLRNISDQHYCVSKEFWIELFGLLNDSEYHNRKSGFNDQYQALYQTYS